MGTWCAVVRWKRAPTGAWLAVVRWERAPTGAWLDVVRWESAPTGAWLAVVRWATGSWLPVTMGRTLLASIRLITLLSGQDHERIISVFIFLIIIRRFNLDLSSTRLSSNRVAKLNVKVTLSTQVFYDFPIPSEMT